MEETYCNVEEFSYSLIVASAAISHRQGVHSTATKDRVLVSRERSDERISLLETSVHSKSYSYRESTKNFFVLGLLSVLKKKKKQIVISFFA